MSEDEIVKKITDPNTLKIDLDTKISKYDIRNKILLLLFILIVLHVIILNVYIIFFKYYNVNITLVGEENVSIIYNEKYNEDGASAKICNIFSCKDISTKIKQEGVVDTSKVGKYTIKYKVKYKNMTKTISREINIIEKEKPVLTLNGESVVKICPNATYNEEGYSAIDNYDGDITNKVKIIKNENMITYEVSDSSGNTSSINREIVHTDEIKPTIKLNGSNNIVLNVGDTYQEPGYNASDNCDGDITGNVYQEGIVDSNTPGNYIIKYVVKDNQNNLSIVQRKITVCNFNTSDIQSYIASLEEYIANKNLRVSIGYYNLNNGYTYTYKPYDVYYGASLVKTVDGIYSYQNLELTAEIKDLVSRAITVSNNPAHKKLVSIIGKDNLRSFGQSLGASHFLVEPTDTYGNTTVIDQLNIWKYLYSFVNTNQNGQELKSYFINTHLNYLLFYNSPVTMHKYGLYDQVYHDVGIVFDTSPYIVVILTKEGKNNYKNIVSDLSMKIYYLNKLVS